MVRAQTPIPPRVAQTPRDTPGSTYAGVVGLAGGVIAAFVSAFVALRQTRMAELQRAISQRFSAAATRTR